MTADETKSSTESRSGKIPELLRPLGDQGYYPLLFRRFERHPGIKIVAGYRPSIANDSTPPWKNISHLLLLTITGINDYTDSTGQIIFQIT